MTLMMLLLNTVLSLSLTSVYSQSTSKTLCTIISVCLLLFVIFVFCFGRVNQWQNYKTIPRPRLCCGLCARHSRFRLQVKTPENVVGLYALAAGPRGGVVAVAEYAIEMDRS